MCITVTLKHMACYGKEAETTDVNFKLANVDVKIP